ncbi:MAG TPA: alpha/beta hydrolase [Candidatus Binataceae bacterium]|nr:alpha/beta hydrolase [Candidatus Binataceae bacterium]
MTDLQHHFVTTNGIKLHYVEQGSGPLVVMCHGFPESWYSWRHQIPALAAAGFRAVAPDQRGYGQTEAPEAVDSYNIFNLVGDIVGLVSALRESQAIIVGHDWGAPVAWHCALLRPDIFRACALLSVPYLPRRPIRPSIEWKALEGTDKHFYQNYFQEPGRVEKELDADPRRSMAMMLYGASGDPPPEERWQFLFPRSKKFIESGVEPKKLPPWLKEADLEFFASEFKRVGFRGGINWYRNFDRNWELTGFLDGVKLSQPSMFAAGEHDAVIAMIGGDAAPFVKTSMPECRTTTIIPGAGHWIQQERPQQINQLLVDFARGL